MRAAGAPNSQSGLVSLHSWPQLGSWHLYFTVADTGVRSVLRFPVWGRGRRCSVRLTTPTSQDEQRGQITMSGCDAVIDIDHSFYAYRVGVAHHHRAIKGESAPVASRGQGYT